LSQHDSPRGRLKQYFNRAIIGPRLLIVDELGYLPFGRDEANLLFNVVARRYEHGSMILTSNLRFTQWADIRWPTIRRSPPPCSIVSCTTPKAS
jgi:DNA replication protein DnaC